MKRALVFGEISLCRFGETEFAGGAAFLFASHLARYGYETAFISAVGNDALGRRLKKEAEKRGIVARYIQTDMEHPSAVVETTLTSEGVPEYALKKHVAWDFIGYTSVIDALLKTPFDLVYFDMIAQRSNVSYDTLTKILGAVDAQHVLFDMNVTADEYTDEKIAFSLNHATILKVNKDEIELLRSTLYEAAAHESDVAIMTRLSDEYRVPTICITLGRDGAIMVHEGNGARKKIPANDYVDAIGLEEAFAAGIALGVLADMPVKKAFERAVRFAAYSAQTKGAIPESYPDALFKPANALEEEDA